MRRVKAIWRWIREATGDDAYERYLIHHTRAHPGLTPLSQREFVRREQERKWNGINRCC